MAEVLAINTTAANSADITLATHDVVASFLLKGSAGPTVDAGAEVLIQRKSSGGAYFTFAALTAQRPVVNIRGKGVYRLSRPAGVSCGVDQD